jgi:hypothetical protein
MKEIVCSEGFHEGDGKERESVEGKDWNLKLMGQVMNPSVNGIPNDAVRWILLHEILDRSMEKHRACVDLARGFKISSGGQRFNAIWEAYLQGGKLNGVKTEEVGIDG